MDLATIRSVALDFLSGAASVPRGPVVSLLSFYYSLLFHSSRLSSLSSLQELFQLEAANEVVPPTPPSKPIPTVLQVNILALL